MKGTLTNSSQILTKFHPKEFNVPMKRKFSLLYVKELLKVHTCQVSRITHETHAPQHHFSRSHAFSIMYLTLENFKINRLIIVKF